MPNKPHPAQDHATITSRRAATLFVALVAVNLSLLAWLIPGVATRTDSTANYREWVTVAFGRTADTCPAITIPHGNTRNGGAR